MPKGREVLVMNTVNKFTGEIGKGYFACTRCRNIMAPQEVIDQDLTLEWAPLANTNGEVFGPVCKCGNPLCYQEKKKATVA